jgi:hypothetical protein
MTPYNVTKVNVSQSGKKQVILEMNLLIELLEI